MKKLLAVVAAVAAGVIHAAEDLPITDGLTLHYDASVAESILCNDAGAVTNWAPVTGSVPLVDAATAYPDATFSKEPVYKVTEDGRVGLQLSHFEGSVGKYTFLCVPNKNYQNIKTMFVVSRQIQIGYYGAIIGRVEGTDYRYCRFYDNYKTCGWQNDWAGLSLVNGVNTKDAAGNYRFEQFGGVDVPHVIAAKHRDATRQMTFESIGAAYVTNKGAPTSNIVYDMCVVHEVVLFNRVLSEAEMMRVSRYLNHKWNLVDPDRNVVWTGAGANANWSNPDNWEDGYVPNANSTVFLSGDATVNLDSPSISVAAFTNLTGAAKLTLNADSDVALFAQMTAPLAVEKTGAGKVTLCGRQLLEGGTSVAAGTLAIKPDLGDVALGAFGTVSFHIDTTHPEAITAKQTGEVTDWASSAGGIVLKSPSTDPVFDGAAYHHGDPRIATDEWGRTCVRFGYAADNTSTGTFFFATVDSKKVDFRPRTQIYVQRQYTANCNGGLSGCITNYNSRIYRFYENSAGKNCDHCFGFNHNAMWCNGRVCVSEEGNNTYEASGTASPNLLVVRDTYDQVFDIIGGQYLYHTAGEPHHANVSALDFDLYEVIFFKESLTDEQIAAISKVLMDKWGVPAQAEFAAETYYPPTTPVEIAAGATFDTGDIAEVALKSISGGGTVAGNGTLDLAGGTLGVGNVDYPAVVNSSETPARIDLDFAGEQTFSAKVTGAVDLTKDGSGTLILKHGMDNEGGTVTLAGGTIKAADVIAPEFGTVTAHLDVSQEGCVVTDGDGRVMALKSVDAGGVDFDAAPLVFTREKDVAEMHLGYAHKVTSAGGYPAVRLGTDAVSNFTGTWFKASAPFSTRTVFIVTTERESSPSATFGGKLYSYGNRISRSWSADNVRSTPYLWTDESAGTIWANGEIGSRQTTNSANTAACLFVSRRNAASDWEALGVAWVRDGGPDGKANSWGYICGRCDLHEVIVFSTALDDDQIARVSSYLMNKWGVPRQAEVDGSILPRALTLTGDDTLDANGSDFALDSLVVDADGSSVLPKLTALPALDLTGTSLTLLNVGAVESGVIVETTGSLTGPFADVTGCAEGMRVKFRAKTASYERVPGISVILR